MAQPRWKKVFERLSEAERRLAKEILRKNLEDQGSHVSEEVLNQMAEKAVKEARAMIRKKGRQALRGLRAGIRAFWDEFKKGAPGEGPTTRGGG
jgi:hypothetical protein